MDANNQDYPRLTVHPIKKVQTPQDEDFYRNAVGELRQNLKQLPDYYKRLAKFWQAGFTVGLRTEDYDDPGILPGARGREVNRHVYMRFLHGNSSDAGIGVARHEGTHLLEDMALAELMYTAKGIIAPPDLQDFLSHRYGDKKPSNIGEKTLIPLSESAWYKKALRADLKLQGKESYYWEPGTKREDARIIPVEHFAETFRCFISSKKGDERDKEYVNDYVRQNPNTTKAIAILDTKLSEISKNNPDDAGFRKAFTQFLLDTNTRDNFENTPAASAAQPSVAPAQQPAAVAKQKPALSLKDLKSLMNKDFKY